jgi:hypothetical protein
MIGVVLACLAWNCVHYARSCNRASCMELVFVRVLYSKVFSSLGNRTSDLHIRGSSREVSEFLPTCLIKTVHRIWCCHRLTAHAEHCVASSNLLLNNMVTLHLCTNYGGTLYQLRLLWNKQGGSVLQVRQLCTKWGDFCVLLEAATNLGGSVPMLWLIN